MNKLYRSRTDKMVAGVAGGLARYLRIDTTLVRLGFVFLAFAEGFGFLLYLMMWFVVPENPEESSEDAVELLPLQENPMAIKVVGGALVLFGGLALIDSLHIEWLRWLRMDTLWPIFLIVGGVLLLRRRELINGENKDE